MTERVAVEEVPFWLDVNGHRAAAWTASPDRLEALAAGWLLAHGYIERPEELRNLELVQDGHRSVGARAVVPGERALRADAERRHRLEHGCGLHYYTRCAPGSLGSCADALPVPDLSVFPGLFRALFSEALLYQNTGGLHTAALTDGRLLAFLAEEVGRHNAVDKSIGGAFLLGEDLSRLGLVLSARISGEIAFRAARAGVGWVASRSVPTTLAVEVARAAGLTLIARAASKDPSVFGPDDPPLALPEEA